MICVLKHLVVLTSMNGEQIKYSIDFEGLEVGDGGLVGDTDETKRTYYCTNCKQSMPGEESFDEAREHIGKPNEVLHPF